VTGPVPGPGLAARIVGVDKRFGERLAVDGVSLDLRVGEMLTILGPSGCGKTTLLRLIAGLELPDAGSIEIAGRRVAGPGASVPPERRRVGMVFQDHALFPHLTVAANVGYGLRSDPDRGVRVVELLELVGLAGEADRMPYELSGGMAQRVALARALAPRPDVVLLDEPFSSLDAALRTQLRGDVREILRASGTSAILVTHDQDEALTLGDRMAVMVRGRIEQLDTPEIVYGEPASPFVATFVGVANLVHAEVVAGVARTALGPVRLVRRTTPSGGAASGPAGDGAEGQPRALAVLRPEHLDVDEAPDGPAEPGTWRILRRRFTGTEILFEVEGPGGDRLWVEAGPIVRRLRIGDRVRLRLRDVETVAFRAGTGHPVTAGGRAAGTATEPGNSPASEPAIEPAPGERAGR
jgi:iron(III) transport system ATP-binding protein